MRDRFASFTRAYAVAALAAIVGMGVGVFLVNMLSIGPTPASLSEGLAGAVLVMAFAFIYLPMLALVPAAIGIAYAKHRRWRSPLPYAVGGVLVASAVVAVFAVLQSLATGEILSEARRGLWTWNGLSKQLAQATLVFGLPGLVGGLTYWAVAVRSETVGKATRQLGTNVRNEPILPNAPPDRG